MGSPVKVALIILRLYDRLAPKGRSMASTARARIGRTDPLKAKIKPSKKQLRPKEEIQFLDMAVEHLKSMSIEEYAKASEKLELIGTKARASF
jgi:hypothetical protein